FWWRWQSNGIRPTGRGERLVQGHHVVCSHVHAMRHGIGAENGSRCGAGRLGITKSLATGKTGSSGQGPTCGSEFDSVCSSVGGPTTYRAAAGSSAAGKTARSNTSGSEKALKP